jgi:hypothetical protein
MVGLSQFYCEFAKTPQNKGFHAFDFVRPMSEPGLCAEAVGAFSCSVELKALTAILMRGFTYGMILALGNSILGKADPTTEH